MSRETWTDERMDDLAKAVDAGFDRVDRQFQRVDHRFDKIDDRLERAEARADERFDAMALRFDQLEQILLRGSFGLVGAIVVALLGLAATHL